jgi:hypothetical protein
MRNMIDPNLSRQEAQGVSNTPDALKPSGAETVISGSNSPDSNSNDSQPEPVLRSTGGCPYHAMLEELDLWQGQEPDR